MNRFLLGLLLAIALTAGCTEIAQIVNPSPVNVVVNPDGTTVPGTGGGTPAGAVSLTLEPPSPISIAAGKNASVKVIAKTSGVEVPTQNLQVAISDLSVASVAEIDGRFVKFSGNTDGTTVAVISANGVQVGILIQVVASE